MSNDDYLNEARQHITCKAQHIVNELRYLLPDGSFYIAGGSLSGQINDVDLFPCDNITLKGDPEVIAKTKNATTYKTKRWPVQVCNYRHDTLSSLVQSFDYSHVQVGVTVKGHVVSEVFFTREFIAAKVSNSSRYTHSEYPLASLVRLLKYHKREDITKHHSIEAVMMVVVDIVQRGFNNYDDFKDQIDAVDLGLVPEDYPKDGVCLDLLEALKRDVFKEDTR